MDETLKRRNVSEMQPNEEAAFIQQDREDLLVILQMRYGFIPEEIGKTVGGITDLNRLQRLIQVAANAPTFEIFIEELAEKEESFRLTGERFSPMHTIFTEGEAHGT